LARRRRVAVEQTWRRTEFRLVALAGYIAAMIIAGD
jgi:hypothetical protein